MLTNKSHDFTYLYKKNKNEVRVIQTHIEDLKCSESKPISIRKDRDARKYANNSLIPESTTSYGISDSQHNSKLSLNTSYNNADKSFSSTDSKLIRIIIYRLSEEIGIPDIMEAISDAVQDFIPPINVIRKYN